jgi:hypothetical protein
MDLDLQAMLETARRGGLYTCADTVAAALPPGCQWREAHRVFRGLPASKRRRALLRPVAAARLVAMKLRLRRAGAEGPAWGVVDAGDVPSFAARTASGHWFAATGRSIVRVHPSRVLAAWEIR